MVGSKYSSCSGARHSSLASQLFKPLLRLLVVRKAAFILSKCTCVVIAAPIDQSGRMFDVQHFVVQDVFGKPLRHIFGVERFANCYAVVDVIVVSEDAASTPL